MHTPQERGYLRLYRKALTATCAKHNITRTQLELMIFAYGIDYFTWEYVYKDFYASENIMTKRVPDLIKKGMLYIYANRIPRYKLPRKLALSQKGKLIVARLYRMIEGDEHIPDIYGRGEI